MCTPAPKNCVACVASIPPTEASGLLLMRIVTRFVTGRFGDVHVLRARSSYSRSHVYVPVTDGNAYEPLAALSGPVGLGNSSGRPAGAGNATISTEVAYRTDQFRLRAAEGAI